MTDHYIATHPLYIIYTLIYYFSLLTSHMGAHHRSQLLSVEPIVIFHNSRHRPVYNLLNTDIIFVGQFTKNLAICACHQTNEAQWICLIVILHDISREESVELATHQIAHILVVEMLAQEERIRTQRAVSARVVIYMVHHSVDVKLIFLKELSLQFTWC